MMKFDLDAIIAFFSAKHEKQQADDPRFSLHQLTFADARLRYNLCIMPGYGTIGLAADLKSQSSLVQCSSTDSPVRK